MPGDAKGTRALHGELVLQSQDTQASGSKTAQSAPTSETVTVIGVQDQGKWDHLSGSGNVDRREGLGGVAFVGDDTSDEFETWPGNDLPPNLLHRHLLLRQSVDSQLSSMVILTL